MMINKIARWNLGVEVCDGALVEFTPLAGERGIVGFLEGTARRVRADGMISIGGSIVEPERWVSEAEARAWMDAQ